MYISVSWPLLRSHCTAMQHARSFNVYESYIQRGEGGGEPEMYVDIFQFTRYKETVQWNAE